MHYHDDFEVIIDGLGSWYEIMWQSHTRHKVKFWDSLKKFPGTSVEQLGKFIGLEKDDKPNFDRYFPIDYEPTEEEVNYCVRDSEVVAKAIKYDLENGYTRMTLASDCFKNAQDRCLNGRFYRDVMPILSEEVDEFCRDAYRGGISYLKPEYEDMEIEHIKVFDVNSLYPWVMHDCPLPYGYGTFVDEEPKDKLFFIRFKCEFFVKFNKFPFIQLKNVPSFRSNQFVTNSDGEVELTLTSVDYKNFLNNYDVYD